MRVYDLTGKPLDLARELKAQGRFDREVLLGANRVRVVALPAPEAVANERRRKARANHDGRLNPSREHLCLMGWNIFLTNLPRAVWPAKALAPLYRLRWRFSRLGKVIWVCASSMRAVMPCCAFP